MIQAFRKGGTGCCRKMFSIASNRQVLAVTHLQQIASMASHHILVAKTESEGRTVTSAKYLDEQEELKKLQG